MTALVRVGQLWQFKTSHGRHVDYLLVVGIKPEAAVDPLLLYAVFHDRTYERVDVMNSRSRFYALISDAP